MASTDQDAGPATGNPPVIPRQDGQRGRGRGGRGRGRGQGGTFNDGTPRDTRQQEGRGGRRGGNRGGNRGSFNGQNNMNATNLPPPAQISTEKPLALKQRAKADGAEEEEGDDVEVCVICASEVVHTSIAPCNHSSCHICALRMRTLYKTKDCPQCRTAAPFVIFTDDASKRYEDFVDAEKMLTQEAIGVRYDNEEIQQDTQILLRYNCPDGDCDVACLSWPDLHRHVRAVHHKKICDLCSRHKKVFTHEHVLYTDKELDRHLKKGDDNPGAIDQSGFKGHPECGFCRQRFYGEDELYVHCREKHERCFICDRRGGQPQYYLNYDSLEKHFTKDHFLCLDQTCLDKKFIVFPSELDLKAHQLEEHKNTLSKDVRRDARVVNMASLDYRAPYVHERRGGGSQREQRDGRGRGRGRDPNAEPIPASSAQPLRRDEQAFQRQLAIQGAQAASGRMFGGQLTSQAPPSRAQPTASTQQQPTITAHRPSNVDVTAAAVQNLDIQPETPQDQARLLRHRGVIERATILLQNDQAKLTQFRNFVSSFKASAITASQLIDSFFALFADTSSNALGTLIREVADLYEDKVKVTSLLTAWNDWRAINEDYPSLPAGTNTSTGSIPLNWAVTSSSSSATPAQNSGAKKSKVLKLKSSTAQSSRSSVSQTRSWGTASGVSSSANPFPDLPAPPSSNTQSTGRITTVPWTGPSSTPNSNPSSAPPSRPSSTIPGKGKSRGGVADFPALPPAPKPQSTISSYGSGRLVRRDGGGNAAGNYSWGGGSGDQSAAASGTEDGDEGANGKGKKKQGKKVVLMNWG